MKLALAALLLLSACATLTGGGNQPIHVETDNGDGASCLLQNAVGSWEIEKTPATVRVARDFSPLHISCAYEAGGPPMTATLEPRTRGRAYGNLLLLGLPAVVDAKTGEGYEYEPDSILLTYPEK